MSQTKKGKIQQLTRGAAYALVAVLIFITGIGVGSGRLVISQNQLFKKPVSKGLPENLDYASVEQIYDTLRKSYDGQLDIDQLLAGLKAGLAEATGDPYTEFLDPEAAQSFTEQLNGTFTGIGAELSKDDQGNIIVVAPISGFPAEKAGLKPQDIIVEVDGESIAGKTVTEAVNKIRGPENSVVKLKIIRDKAKEHNIEIARAKITVPSVTSEIKDNSAGQQIGYIRISRFSEDTEELARKAANEMKSANVKGIVLDVRNNAGGLLDAAVSVSNLWLEPGQAILQEKRGDVLIKSFKASKQPILKGVPTVVLINEGSASASEIVAGALKDNGSASLVGMKSFGKGSVQQLEKFSDGSMLKVTIARWFTPGGINIDQEGIKPDQEVKISEEDAKNRIDSQLQVALDKLR